MNGNEFTFRIDAFTPENLPMARLAEYMAALARLVGHEKSTHFVGVRPGSACLVSRVDDFDLPKVQTRLRAVETDSAPPEAAKAFKALDEMLAADNAVGELTGLDGDVVIPFPGRERPKPLTFPAFRQDGSIDGEIVNIGGKDSTAHIILKDDAVTYSNISLTRDQAREMAKYLYGPKIRIFGIGRWERHPEGAWKLLSFNVDRYEILDDEPLHSVLSEIRNIPGNALTDNGDAYNDLMSLRVGEDGVH